MSEIHQEYKPHLLKWRNFLFVSFILMTVFPSICGAEDAFANRQTKVWESADGTVQIPLWPANSPSQFPISAAESYGNESKQIAGQPYTMVDHVSRPTMTIFHPPGTGNGATIMVFPGGGYRRLAIDLEGTEVCDWLTAKGFTCVLLKYRVPASGPYWSDDCDCRRIPGQPYALQDAQRAMGLLRERANGFGIDPHKIGVLGFSAGGHMVAEISNRETRSYPSIDAADRQSSRPDFAIAVYPGHLWQQPGLTLNPAVQISAHCPPTLIIAASDDPVDDVRHSLTYYLALKKANIPVEMHLYAHGGHAFGVRMTSEAATHWTDVAEQWMNGIGIAAADARESHQAAKKNSSENKGK